jgi:uncharacterized protein YbbC (DUF1343 family)
MQDVGCRIYTVCLHPRQLHASSAQARKEGLVCDRPNPINGVSIAGKFSNPNTLPLSVSFRCRLVTA